MAGEKHNRAFAQILHICSMHIDKCYFQSSNACFSILRRYIACFDARSVIVWLLVRFLTAKKGCLQRCLLFRFARHRGRATTDPALPFPRAVGDRAVLWKQNRWPCLSGNREMERGVWKWCFPCTVIQFFFSSPYVAKDLPLLLGGQWAGHRASGEASLQGNEYWRSGSRTRASHGWVVSP